ncbi:hypothetical protein M407DRAFT_4247 [Tulasnella calospora MUT 4182]|uniref:Uncharacterized protein n=1 Tax=Tulasnella calospora MUT 4182 TaxID=1051891 RepID=A0A0C3LGF1_9AGAM|nr:hypothetical protein M407DRAFT_4247 [Tulasnella calospora MUT 4182]
MSDIPVSQLSDEQLQKEYVRVKLTKRGNVSGMLVNGFLTPVMGITAAGFGVAAVRHHNNKKRMLELEEELRRRGIPIPVPGMIANVSAVCGGGMASVFLCPGTSFVLSDGQEASGRPNSPTNSDPCTIPTPAAAPPPQDFQNPEKDAEPNPIAIPNPYTIPTPIAAPPTQDFQNSEKSGELYPLADPDPGIFPTPATGSPTEGFQNSEKIKKQYFADNNADIQTTLPPYPGSFSHQNDRLSLESRVDEFNF